MTARRWLAALVVAACVPVAGCGYALTGTGRGVFPEHIKTIAIRPFENRTERPEIEQRLTEAVSREFARRSNLRVISNPANADAVMDGAVLQFTSTPVQFNAAGRATRMESQVSLQATVRETATDEVMWSQSGLLFRQQYDVADQVNFFDQETLSLDIIAEGAAGVLVTSMVEGF